MARLDWIVLCERAIVEAQSNTISLVAIVEVLAIGALPPAVPDDPKKRLALPFRFYAVQQWTRSNPNVSETALGRLVLKGPDGKRFGHVDFFVDLTKTPRSRVISQIVGFPWSGLGLYKYIVQIKHKSGWRKLGETEFNLQIGPPIESIMEPKTRH